MKKVSIISACTDLGLKIDGAELGAQALTECLESNNISQNYILKSGKKTEEMKLFTSSNKKDINHFVDDFNSLLLDMHEIHFEENMNAEEKNAYYEKMHNLVLAVKALDTKNEKRKAFRFSFFLNFSKNFTIINIQKATIKKSTIVCHYLQSKKSF